MKAHRSLNTMGQFCPQPIIETAKAIRSMRTGQILHIISDDWGLVPDIQAWCESTGNHLITIADKDTYVEAFLKKASLRKISKKSLQGQKLKP